MSLFDLFKKKSAPLSADNNTLETVLQKAALEPAYRAELYKRLLTDELIVLTAGKNISEGHQTLQQDTAVNIVSLTDGKIPLFTSTERIFKKKIIKEQVQFMKMKGEDLFRFTKGSTFILNPYSQYGKELLPGEVESMLSGTILTTGHTQIKIEKETSVQIGQPVHYPTEIVESLKKLFSDRPAIKAAYLGWIYNPTSGQPPHYIFALDGEGDLQNITHEAGFIAKQLLKQGDIVDFTTITDRRGINDYFLNDTTAFYKR